MGIFSDEIKAINKERKKAASFLRVDLHVHSHESYDFPKIGNKDGSVKQLSVKDDNPSLDDYYLAIKSKGDLQIVAITDHHVSRVSCDLSEGSKAFGEFLILPGIELSVQTDIFGQNNIHILAIFPEGTSSEDIERIISEESQLPNYNKRGKDSCCKFPLDKFIRRVHQKNGICVASHVNSNKGIRNAFRGSNVKLLIKYKTLDWLKNNNPSSDEIEILQKDIANIEDDIQVRYLDLLSKYDFDAVEIAMSTENKYYSGLHTDKIGIGPIACLLGSDSHNLCDIGLSGHTTLIKMTERNMSDLSKALKDPQTRIRYQDTIEETNYPKIQGIFIDGGFFDKKAFGFSDNLSCIIGGRGTGKSSLIDAIRLVFGDSYKGPNETKKNDIQGRAKYTLSDSIISILFEDADKQKYILRYNYENKETEIYDLDGNLLKDIIVADSSKFSLKIYGWGEIEELATDKKGQLDLVDGFVEEASGIKNKIDEQYTQLEQNTTEVCELAKVIEETRPKIKDLPEKRDDLNRLNTTELNKIFSDYDEVDHDQRVIKNIQAQTEEFFNFVNEFDENSIYEKYLHVIKQDIGEDDHKAEQIIREIETKASGLDKKFRDFVGDVEKIKSNIQDSLNKVIQKKEEIERKLREKAISNEDIGKLIDRRRKLTKEVKELEEVEKEINIGNEQLRLLLVKRFVEIIPELTAKQRQLFEARNRKIKDINGKLADLGNKVNVRIELEFLRNRSQFQNGLGSHEENADDGILKKSGFNYKEKKAAFRISESFLPYEFVQLILDRKIEELRTGVIIDDDTEQLSQEDATHIVEHLYPKEENFFSSKLLRQLLQLEHIKIYDMPIIVLDETPIEKKSPGQRCSALIPIILMESDLPLIIDQPEDNLDNKLVFSLVVDILRELKQKRQIITATHNPNIPVSGDSEQIIVLDTNTKDKCENISHGSIDNATVINWIKKIMEGSEEAFRIRAEKYGYKLGEW